MTIRFYVPRSQAYSAMLYHLQGESNPPKTFSKKKFKEAVCDYVRHYGGTYDDDIGAESESWQHDWAEWMTSKYYQ